MTAKKKNQHTVARFYLNRFVDPTAAGPDPYVWVADLDTEAVRRKAPTNLARRPYFYRIEELEAAGVSLEDAFMKLESACAQPIRRFGELLPVTLPQQERVRLAHFLAHQFTRTPRFWSMASAVAHRRTATLIDRLLTDEAHLESLLSRLGHQGLVDRQALKAAIQRVQVPPTQAGIASVSLNCGQLLAERFWEMRWSRLVTEEGEFCTTDNPVALLTPDAQPRDILHPELLVGFPLSPRVLLVLDNRSEDVRDSPLSVGDVDQIVRGILPTAERFIFCASRARAEWALDQLATTRRVVRARVVRDG